MTDGYYLSTIYGTSKVVSLAGGAKPLGDALVAKFVVAGLNHGTVFNGTLADVAFFGGFLGGDPRLDLVRKCSCLNCVYNRVGRITTWICEDEFEDVALISEFSVADCVVASV